MGLSGRVAPPLLGVLISAALLAQTRGLDEIARAGQLGPGFWPRLALVGLALTCLVRVAQAWRQHPGGGRDAGEPIAGQGGAPPALSVPRLVTAVALLLLYVASTPVVGFPLATAGFMTAFLVLGGARSVAAVAGCAVGGTILLLYVFVRVVYLPLPKGAGPLEDVTVALYRVLGIF
jgi:hypothetical protein